MNVKERKVKGFGTRELNNKKFTFDPLMKKLFKQTMKTFF